MCVCVCVCLCVCVSVSVCVSVRPVHVNIIYRDITAVASCIV